MIAVVDDDELKYRVAGNGDRRAIGDVAALGDEMIVDRRVEQDKPAQGHGIVQGARKPGPRRSPT